MSALLTSTIGEPKATIQALVAATLRDGVKVVIGGAPINQEYADRIGANGYALNAVAAVQLAKELLKEWLEVSHTASGAS